MLSTSHHRNRSQRKGVILVLCAVLMAVMMGFIALSVDVGYMHTVQTEMDRAVDAAALAGASALPAGSVEAENVARTFVAMNQVANTSLFGDEVTVTVGHWNEGTRVFTPDNNSPSAIMVDALRADQRPRFFANIWGIDQFYVDSSAVALFKTRDIMVVLDYSGSKLVNNGRSDAVRKIVLMTDGVPTYPENSTSARTLALAAAEACADAEIPVATIALGSGADVPLMQQIADITGGIGFTIPGGRPIAEIEEDLRVVSPSCDRPLKAASQTR